MQCDLDEEVKRVGHPYVAVLVGDNTIQFFIIHERLDAVIALVGASLLLVYSIISNFICYAFLFSILSSS